MTHAWKIPALAAALLTLSAGAAGAAGAASPVVVELFTSQGCSSCPPANANLTTIADRPDVLALSFGVTYWDYLGWKDSFAKPEFTNRQYAYVQSLHAATAYTPQMVVNGSMDLVGNSLDEIERKIAVARAEAPAAPEIRLTAGAVSIGAGTPPADFADVYLVRYNPDVVQVPVARGENGGRTLPHKNVVHDFLRLGDWTGQAVQFDLPPAEAGLKTAILLQDAYTGPILAAAKD